MYVTIVFDISWDDCNIQEVKSNGYPKFGGGEQGALWSM